MGRYENPIEDRVTIYSSRDKRSTIISVQSQSIIRIEEHRGTLAGAVKLGGTPGHCVHRLSQQGRLNIDAAGSKSEVSSLLRGIFSALEYIVQSAV